MGLQMTSYSARFYEMSEPAADLACQISSESTTSIQIDYAGPGGDLFVKVETHILSLRDGMMQPTENAIGEHAVMKLYLARARAEIEAITSRDDLRRRLVTVVDSVPRVSEKSWVDHPVEIDGEAIFFRLLTQDIGWVAVGRPTEDVGVSVVSGGELPSPLTLRSRTRLV